MTFKWRISRVLGNLRYIFFRRFASNGNRRRTFRWSFRLLEDVGSRNGRDSRSGKEGLSIKKTKQNVQISTSNMQNSLANSRKLFMNLQISTMVLQLLLLYRLFSISVNLWWSHKKWSPKLSERKYWIWPK
jgi:hypothetical protein